MIYMKEGDVGYTDFLNFLLVQHVSHFVAQTAIVLVYCSLMNYLVGKEKLIKTLKDIFCL